MLMTTRLTATALALCLTFGPALAGTTDPLPSQSPVNIITRQAQFDPSLPALDFSYASSASLTIVDTRGLFIDPENATVRADVPSGSTLSIAGTIYNLLQFHLHVPAEHEIDGHRGDMELHLVHQSALGALAVVGQIITVGDEENEALAPYFNALAGFASVIVPGTSPSVAVADFDLTQLIPERLESYRYSGSLTAPSPLTEGAEIFFEPVEWNVLAEEIEVSREQFEAFQRLFEEGNSRPVQPLNDRTILTDVAAIPLPASGLLFLFAVGGLAALRRRAA